MAARPFARPPARLPSAQEGPPRHAPLACTTTAGGPPRKGLTLQVLSASSKRCPSSAVSTVPHTQARSSATGSPPSPAGGAGAAAGGPAFAAEPEPACALAACWEGAGALWRGGSRPGAAQCHLGASGLERPPKAGYHKGRLNLAAACRPASVHCSPHLRCWRPLPRQPEARAAAWAS